METRNLKRDKTSDRITWKVIYFLHGKHFPLGKSMETKCEILVKGKQLLALRLAFRLAEFVGNGSLGDKYQEKC